MEETLEENLPVAKAWQLTEKYGKEKYGDDFEVHYATGLIDQEAIDKKTWSLAATCDVNGVEKTCKSKVKLKGDTISLIEFEVN